MTASAEPGRGGDYYEALARALVVAGKASVTVLDRPDQPNRGANS